MGLPRLWGRVRPARSASAEAVPIGPAGVNGEGKRADGSSSRAAHYDDHIGWTVAYYTLLVGGALGFWWLLWPLTESENALAGFAV